MTQGYTLSTQSIKDAFVAGRLGLYTEIPAEAIARNEENFDAWLAAHDAQIRAEALGGLLSLSHLEQEEFAKAMFESLGKYGLFDSNFYDRDEPYEIAFTEAANGHFGFDAVEAGIKAVNQLRETSKEEQQQ